MQFLGADEQKVSRDEFDQLTFHAVGHTSGNQQIYFVKVMVMQRATRRA